MFKFNGMGIEWVRSKILFIGGGILASIFALPFLIPDVAYKHLIQQDILDKTGFETEFNGAFSISLLPTIRIEADTIEFSKKYQNNVEMAGSVDLAIFDMGFGDFFRGRIYINEFVLQSPKVSLNGDFVPHLPQWVRQNLAINSKSSVRYQEILFRLIQRTAFRYAEVTEGTLIWNKGPQETVEVEKFRISMEKPLIGHDLVIDADAYVNDRSVDFDLKLERPDQFLKGYRSGLVFNLDSNPFKLSFDGNAAHRRNFVARGDLELSIPSTYEYCRWFNNPDDCQPSAKGFNLASELRFRDQQLQVEQAVAKSNDYEVALTGVLDFKPIVPEITAEIETPEQDLYELIESLDQTAAFNFNDLLIDAYNANVNVKSKGLKIAANEIITPDVKFVVEDRRLAISSENLRLFGGNTNFRFRWNKGLDDGYMDLRYDSNGIDLVRMQRALGQNFQTAGTLKSSFEIQSVGSSLNALMETARIYGEFAVLDGVFFNENVAKSLGGDNVRNFEFAEMKGRINGDRGEIRSSDIRIIAPNSLINGQGNYDFLSNQLKVQLQSETPVLSSTGEGNETEKGFVEIAGSLSKLGLATSMTVDSQDEFKPFDGVHSGLLPITDDNNNNETQEDFFINESDLLD